MGEAYDMRTLIMNWTYNISHHRIALTQHHLGLCSKNRYGRISSRIFADTCIDAHFKESIFT